MSVSNRSLREYLEFFHKHCHFNMKWLGKRAEKTPFDCWVYQEIIWETSPDVIIEIGNYGGGSTLFLANILDACGKGRVLAVDIDHSLIDFTHPRIEWIEGDAQGVFSIVKSRIKQTERVMVIEDSSHTKENTLALLRLYGPLVSEGCYYIVEDTILEYDFPFKGAMPGPLEATKEFLKENDEFIIDRQREKFILSYNTDGYLKRIRPSKNSTTIDLPGINPYIRPSPTHLERLEEELMESKSFIEEQGKIIRHLESKEKEVEALRAFIEEQGKIIKHLAPKEKEVADLQSLISKIHVSKTWRILSRIGLLKA